MSGWKEVKLGSVAKVISGYAFKSADFIKETGVPVIKIKNIKNGGIDLADCDFASSKFLTLNEKYHIKRNDILVSLTGSHITQPNSVVGRIAIYKHGHTALLNQRAGKILPNGKLVDKLYLYSYLSQDSVKEAIASKARGAANQANISPGDVEDTDIILPPLSIQQSIASILSAYDDLIENNLKRIKLLEELAERTYEEWFVKFRIDGKALEMDDVTGLPVGWKIRKLKEVALINQKSLRKDFKGKLKYVDISSVSTGSIDSFIEYDFSDAPGRARRIIDHGDIIWSCVRPNRKSYSIVWNPEENLIVSTGFTVITPASLPTSYLSQFLSTHAFVGYLTNLAGGAAYPAVTSTVFSEADIVVPDKYLVGLFDNLIKPTIEKRSNLQRQNDWLKEARDILLPRLMNGSIGIGTVETQPATKIIQLDAPTQQQATPQFKEAILISLLTFKFGSEKYPLGRMRYTKLSYLFHRHADNQIKDYLRKAAGPYNPKTKYGGPEKIAHDNGYVADHKSGQLTGFIAGPNIEKAKPYFESYWDIEYLTWLEAQFKYKSNDDLELFATVDNSLIELNKKNKPFTVEAVKNILKKEPQWTAKLEREIFSDLNILRAVTFLPTIFQY
jgi:restriction endonuclease S subunit